MSSRTTQVWLVAASCLVTLAQAAPAPLDPGTALRDTDRARRVPPSVTAPDAGVPAAPGDAAKRPSGPASEVKIRVNRIVIPAGYAVSQEEVDEALEGRLGRDLTFIQIFDCLDVVANLFKQRGYPFARVFLPEQRVTSSDIQVRIYTGVVDGVEAVCTTKEPRIAPEAVAARVSSAIPRGKSFYQPAAERGLLLAADLVGKPVSGQLSPGRDLNTTKLTVAYDDVPATSWQVSADNFGNKFTGRARLAADGRVNSSMFAGDVVNFGLTGSEDLRSWRVGYKTPVGPSGWTVGLGYSDVHYALSGAFAGFEGDAREFRVHTSYPLIRTRQNSLYFDAAFASRDLKSINGPLSLPRQVDAGTLGLRSESYDGWLGGGVLTAGASVVFGDASADSTSDPAAIRGATGSYSKVLLDLARLQRLAEGTVLSASLRAQLASDNLDTSEQGSLGGPYGVRSYASEEGTGDQFTILSLELQQQITDGWSAKAFVDHGTVAITKDSYTGFTGRRSYGLSDIGLGLDWSGDLLGASTVLSITGATALGNNPGLSGAGLDSEGGTSTSRVWISLTSRF